jgi:hypothetical protein
VSRTGQEVFMNPRLHVAVVAAVLSLSPMDLPDVRAQDGSFAHGAVVVRDGRITLRAANQSLNSVLDEIARGAPPLAITLAPELEADRVSLAFANVPLDEGLRRILSGYDTFFSYAAAGRGATSSSLVGVWVFPRGGSRGLAPLDAVAWASDADIERRLTDPDPDIRIRALKALIDRRGEAAIGPVLTALAGEDEVVRAQVLDLASGGGLSIPVERLLALALNDPAPLIRLQALQLTPDCPELVVAAEAARQDPDPYVRLEAEAILARLAAASAPGATAKRDSQP